MPRTISDPFLRDAVSVVFDGLIVHDGTVVLEANERAAHMFGYESAEAMVGVPYLDLFIAGSRNFTEFRSNSRNEGYYSAVCRREDGEEFPAEVNAKEVVASGVRARIAAFRYGPTSSLADSEVLAQRHLALDQTVKSLSRTIEQRDTFTAGHQSRVAKLGIQIADKVGMSSREIVTIRIAGNIHDIGKIAVPAEILMKPGALTDQEYELVKIHPATGHQIVSSIDFDGPVHETILQHHERLDGSGYPSGIKEPIPEARVLAVADVYDALTSTRPYRMGESREGAMQLLEKQAGALDAEVIKALSALGAEQAAV